MVTIDFVFMLMYILPYKRFYFSILHASYISERETKNKTKQNITKQKRKKKVNRQT